MFIRKLYALTDITLLEQHLLRLDSHSRAARFMANVAISDQMVARYCASRRGDRCLGFGAFIRGTLVAVAEVIPVGAGIAEMAVSVESAYRGRGIGKDLARRSLNHARNVGIKQVRVSTLICNTCMKRLASSLGGVSMRGDYPGEMIYMLTLEPLDLFSLAMDGIDSFFAFAGGFSGATA